MDALQVNHLTQTFHKNTVLQDISFTVPTGSVFGFLGKNGAGKTTTMKIILGLLKPTRGSVTVFGEPVTYGQTKTNQLIGYLPDVPAFYNFMYPKEYLQLCREIAPAAHEPATQIADLLHLVGLENENRKIGSFSRGMKQRLGIAQALLNQPKLLICDEPTSALDPIGRKELLDILFRVKEQTTVVFSTHILSDVDRICDQVAIINEGKIVLAGATQTLKTKGQKQRILLEFKNQAEQAAFIQLKELSSLNVQVIAQAEILTVKTADTSKTISALMKIMLLHQLIPCKLEVQEPTFEDLFMEVVQ